MTAAGEQTRNRAQARVGTTIRDKWRLDALLGLGGTAAVYAATHRNGRRGAVKILRSELTGMDEVTTRFAREGYLANKIQHPAVVAVLDDDVTEDGAPFLVMELLDGYSLDRHTRGAQTVLDVATAVRVTDAVLDVLAVAHELGIVHRDVKPANVFMSHSGEVRMLDFGIARLTDSLDGGMTQTGTAIGTPGYMAPEQARGRWSEVDARTDLWAVGASLYAMLLGERPRRADTVQEELLAAMTQPMVPAAQRLRGVPAALCAFIDKSVAFERSGRFDNARAMQQALRAIDLSASAMTPPAQPFAMPFVPDEATVATGPSWQGMLPEELPPVGGSVQTLASQPVAMTAAAPPSRRAAWFGWALAAVGVCVLGAGLALWTARKEQPATDLPQANAAAEPAPAAATTSSPLPSGTGVVVGDAASDPSAAAASAAPVDVPPSLDVPPLASSAPARAEGTASAPKSSPSKKPAAPKVQKPKTPCDPYAHPEGCN